MFAEFTRSEPAPKTILTIEDEVNIRTSFALFLTDFGYQVLKADNGITGLELFQRHQPDLVLLDLCIPGRDGFECLKQLRKQNPQLPIIIISGMNASNDVVRALHLGAWGFILKPILDLQVLRHSIEKAFERTRLKQENLEYQKKLEEKVDNRTQALKLAYEQLAESEKRYRSIYENLQDIYYEVSPEGILLEISPSCENNFHYQRAELIVSNILHYYADPADRQQFLQDIQATGRVNDYEIRLVDKNGEIISFSLNATLYLNQAGQPDYISGILRNIAQRKQDEDELRNSQQTLVALFNAAPLAILAIDTNMHITLWNKAAEAIFGWTRNEIIGRPYPLAAPGKEQESEANLLRALAGDQLKGLELSRRHKDGHLLEVSASTAPLRDKSNAICGVIIIIEDICEKQRLRSEADRYSRLASLGELAAGVAHEINNPNGLILLNLPTVRDFIMDAITLQQEVSHEQPTLTMGGFEARRAAAAFPQLMTELEDSARCIKQIVEDLKDFSRQEGNNPEDCFDINLSAEKAQRLAANHIKKTTAHFNRQLARDIPAVKGSPQRVEQVIVNLLVNACEALTDQQQSITLATGYIQKQQEVFLRVSDTGRGINADQLPHITDPFFTTRRDEGGTGLGLSVSARIIKEHNGRLQFTSNPGTGTTVSIFFPTASKAC